MNDKGEAVPFSPKGVREKKEPRWVVAFLRALERTGEARAAAEDAGVDYTTAYGRRRAHADFAVAWAEALKAHEAAKKQREKEEGEAMVASLPTPPLPPVAPQRVPPSPAEGG